MKKENIWFYVKIFLTLYVSILIPLYWYNYGVQNFLWISDVSLFLTVIALWLSSPFLMSIAAVGALAAELLWSLDFLAGLILNNFPIHIAGYMASPTKPLMLRGLSLFHSITPIIWIFYLKQYGYDKRALYYFTALYWIILFLTYFFTDPERDINYVFLPTEYSIGIISPSMWVIVLAISGPLIVFSTTHYLLTKLFSKRSG